MNRVCAACKHTHRHTANTERTGDDDDDGGDAVAADVADADDMMLMLQLRRLLAAAELFAKQRQHRTAQMCVGWLEMLLAKMLYCEPLASTGW